jgi:hypothetical protein
MIESRTGYLSLKERIKDMYSQEQVLNTIKEKSMEFIRLQFSDIQGRGKNVTVPVNNTDKEVTNQTTVTVNPINIEFYSYPVSIDEGESTTLHWNITSADVSKSYIDNGFGFLDDYSNAFDRASASTITYTLHAVNSAGEEVKTKQTTVTVNPINVRSAPSGWPNERQAQ